MKCIYSSIALFAVIILLVFSVMVMTPLFAAGESCWECAEIGECAGCQLKVGPGGFDNCGVPNCEQCLLTGPGCEP